MADLSNFCQAQPFLFCSLVFLLGCCVGSFLNVLALRSLKEESIVWPGSYCPQCNHPLAAWDNIPLISFLILGGKCRYCRKTISWQYPLVELLTGLTYAGLAYVFMVITIPLAGFIANPSLPLNPLETHDLFQAIKHGAGGSAQTLDSPDLLFHKFGLFFGMLAFASTLIAVTITDFREKLIPHEITYPSMIIGIAFSALVRGDLLGAMAGIGASYIIFDFLAFYGLKIYMLSHRSDMEDDEQADSSEAEDEDEVLDRTFDIRPAGPEEPVEVMGGGDAVLSAVMSAYLGWQLLVFALVIGFIAGTAMGLVLLAAEMKKAKLLKECGQKSLKWALICGLIFGIVMGSIPMLLPGADELGTTVLKTALYGACMGAAGGALIGMVRVGTRVSKPFPFGPALALGGFIAMFLIPYWLPFY